MKTEITYVPVKQLIADRFNPRQDFNEDEMTRLQESVKENGILQPLLIEPTDDPNKFLIVDGERRFRVANRLGMDTVPTRSTGKPLTMLERILTRFNLQEVHSPWSAYDKSVAIAELQAITGWDGLEISRRLGVPRTTVYTLLGIQSLSKRVLKTALDRQVSINTLGKFVEATSPMKADRKKISEELFMKHIEDGKLAGPKDVNTLVFALKNAKPAALNKMLRKSTYTSEQAIADSDADHIQHEFWLRANLNQASGHAKFLLEKLQGNKKLNLTQKTTDNIRRNIVHLKRLHDYIVAEGRVIAQQE